MNYLFHRNILAQLHHWSTKKERKPLVVRGARQVGKTTAVHHFGTTFEQYIYLNLERPQDQIHFREDKSIHEVVDSIFFSAGKRKDLANTLLFIDEIQAYPQAVNRLRYFYEEFPDLRIISAGSLLETLMDRKINFPVGRVEYLFMRPVSFGEFLTALGEENAFLVWRSIPIPSYAHELLLELFKTYLKVGGMPEVVKKFAQKKDLVDLQSVYHSLIITYQDDVEKYARNDSMARVIQHCIKAGFAEAGKRIKFEGFGKSNYRSREVGEALRTLEKAMLIHLVYPITATDMPIEPDLRKSPKLQALDSGLLNFRTGYNREIFLASEPQPEYGGKVSEHLVGQELLSGQFHHPGELNFWTREKKQSQAEVDFVVYRHKMLVPIEVKSGQYGTLRSLHQFMEESSSLIGIRISRNYLKLEVVKTPGGKPFLFMNLPAYLTALIPQYLDWALESEEFARVMDHRKNSPNATFA